VRKRPPRQGGRGGNTQPPGQSAERTRTPFNRRHSGTKKPPDRHKACGLRALRAPGVGYMLGSAVTRYARNRARMKLSQLARPSRPSPGPQFGQTHQGQVVGQQPGDVGLAGHVGCLTAVSDASWTRSLPNSSSAPQPTSGLAESSIPVPAHTASIRWKTMARSRVSWLRALLVMGVSRCRLTFRPRRRSPRSHRQVHALGRARRVRSTNTIYSSSSSPELPQRLPLGPSLASEPGALHPAVVCRT
jgi:hypothetical protein